MIYLGSDPVGISGDGLVNDVQVNGTSILNNGVANIPISGTSVYGTVKTDAPYGVYVNTGTGYLTTSNCTTDMIKEGTNNYRTLKPSNVRDTVFYGLANAAGDTTQALSSNATGNYTDEAKIAIQKMLGIYEPLWELIADVTTTENLAEVAITTDGNGEPFALSEMFTRVKLPQPLTGTNDYVKGQTYAKLSNSANPEWNSLSTTRYTSGTSSAVFEYHHEILAGICRLTVRSGSSAVNAQNLQSMSFPDMDVTAQVESINGIKLQQYNSSTTLIPSGTIIKIYGRRKQE